MQPTNTSPLQSYPQFNQPIVGSPRPPVSSTPKRRFGLIHLVVMVMVGVILFAAGVGAGYLWRGVEVNDLQAQLQAAKSKSNAASTNPFEAVQAKARDSERQTDVNSVSTTLEVYFNDTGGYPGIGVLNNDTIAKSTFPSLDLQYLRAPGQAANSYVASAEPTSHQYGYLTYESDGATACASDQCPRFVIYYRMESTGEVRHKESLN